MAAVQRTILSEAVQIRRQAGKINFPGSRDLVFDAAGLGGDKWEFNMNRYYYRQMNRQQQSVYHAMLEGFTSLASSFPVLRLSMRELSEIFFRLRLDNPWIFYVTSFSCRYAEGAESMQLTPVYMFEKKKIKEHQKALQGRVARLVRPAQAMRTDLEKELYIHEFICNHVTYDKLKKSYSHEIIGSLQQGIGVCEGIAKTVKLLCDEMGIPCIIAICDADPDHGVKYRHAWNVIKIQGQWYHLDATFDNSLGRYGQKRFDYFNLDDKKIFRDHRPVMYPIPACTDGNHFYYKENRLSLTKMEDVGKRLRTVLRKKQEYFVFHWRGGYLTREVLLEIAAEAAKTAQEKEKYIRMSFNYSQAVIQLRIIDTPPEEHAAIHQEEADEGENLAEDV